MNNSDTKRKNIVLLLNKLAIQPNNLTLYIEALTHPSYANDLKLNYNYEKLEFLGDSIINFVVADYLYKTLINEHVGELSKNRTLLVQSKTEVLAAKKIKLLDCVYLGRSLLKVKDFSKILEDTFESLIGAIYLDQGIDKATQIIKKLICNIDIKDKHKELIDYKSKFQELTMKYSKYDIKYDIKQDKSGTYIASLWCNGICYGKGRAKKIKEAEQKAAKIACETFVG